MPDIDRLIKAWEIFRDSNPYEICNGREFRAIREPEYCMGQMIEDTIALLKEQKAKPVKIVRSANGYVYCRCPKCNRIFYEEYERPKHCDICGQEVKFE